MTRPEIRPFEPGDVAAAGGLLARRHAAHRAAEPLLSARFEDPAAAATEVQSLLDGGATGAVAAESGDVTGYLLGGSRPDTSWGPNVWVEPAGHAVTEAETVRDLYAAAAPSWVERGLEVQYAIVPAHDAALVDAWFRLGFGQQHVHGIREVPDAPWTPPAHLTVRPARREDIPVLAQLDGVLPTHQALAPTFSAGPLTTLQESIDDWEESFDDEGFCNLVVEHDGRIVGSAAACALEKSGGHKSLAVPDRAGFLGYAAVFPDARGLGAGRALGEATLEWMRRTGFTSAVADWRATNLLSSRAWSAVGYRPSFLRLHRRLGY
ncbi:MAG TPA: GNAT family N-acetyltransferase [Actinomycetes bacterium]